MSTATIYARVPAETKAAVEEYATRRGLTLTSGLHDLLQLGLEASENAPSVESLQRRVADLEQEVRAARLGQREEAIAREQVARELAGLRQAASSWAARAEVPLGHCASCNAAITGRDLLVSGTCPECHAPTSGLIEPKTDQLNKNDLMLTLGGIGLLLGILVVAGNRG